MIIDPHHQLKTDLYTTVPDLLICEAVDLPYQLILWGDPISHDEAIRRIDDLGTTGRNYRIWTNPSISVPGTVSVIHTDDKDAERTVATGLFSTCYRAMTPAQAIAQEAQKRSVFPWRLTFPARPPLNADFDHIVEPSDRVVSYHTGYQPEAPRWAPDICWLGTIHAIHVRDHYTAILLKTAIGEVHVEGPGAA